MKMIIETLRSNYHFNPKNFSVTPGLNENVTIQHYVMPLKNVDKLFCGHIIDTVLLYNYIIYHVSTKE